MRVIASVSRRFRLTFGSNGVAKLERDPAKQIMRFGVLRIAADGVAQIDLG